MNEPEAVLNLQPGTLLDHLQSAVLADFLYNLITEVRHRRRSTLLVHNSIQRTIGQFLRRGGAHVSYEVPFATGGFVSQRSVFDIVIQGLDNRNGIVEVKETVTPRDLGQVQGYISSLKEANEIADVYLGTDILNYRRLISGALGTTIKEMMSRDDLGIMLADKYCLLIFGTHSQLTLNEMPMILLWDESVG